MFFARRALVEARCHVRRASSLPPIAIDRLWAPSPSIGQVEASRGGVVVVVEQLA